MAPRDEQIEYETDPQRDHRHFTNTPSSHDGGKEHSSVESSLSRNNDNDNDNHTKSSQLYSLEEIHAIMSKNKDDSPYRYILFRLYGLRFGMHGCMGIASTILLLYSLVLVQLHKLQLRQLFVERQSQQGEEECPTMTDSGSFQLPLWLGLSILITTLINAFGSYGILSQVPTSTTITSWIIPPHKEAFKRTISIVGYLNLRILQFMGLFEFIVSYVSSVLLLSNNNDHGEENNNIQDKNDNNAIAILLLRLGFPIMMATYNFFKFTPFNASLKNGNTWIFIIPMWIGFNADTYHQFPSFSLSLPSSSSSSLWNIIAIGGSNTTSNCDAEDSGSVMTAISNILSTASWDRVTDYNSNVVDLPYILLTQFCAMQVAFMFTLAFRGIMETKKCYWIAAVVVGMLCVRLVTH